MRYIIHVIDDASQHEIRENNEYGITPGLTDDNAICDIMRTDAWYTIEADSPLDAVAILANTIEVKNSDGGMISLSKAVKETHNQSTITDFSENDSKKLIDDTFVKIITNSRSTFYLASCKIQMKIDDQEWVELHKVHFYLIEDTNLIEI